MGRGNVLLAFRLLYHNHEENTHAYNLEDDLPEEIKQVRANEIMELQS